MQVWNPAFDVTPSRLIRGIITEHGIIEQRDGTINVIGFLRDNGLLQEKENGERRSCIRSVALPGSVNPVKPTARIQHILQRPCK